MFERDDFSRMAIRSSRVKNAYRRVGFRHLHTIKSTVSEEGFLCQVPDARVSPIGANLTDAWRVPRIWLRGFGKQLGQVLVSVEAMFNPASAHIVLQVEYIVQR